ncbi:MAG: hypothetical protein ACSLE0_00325 [Chitinophagaceae bacterium]
MLVGDSLARGVGAKLDKQSNMFSTVSIGGARIETVTDEVGTMEDKEDRHLVIIAGTNNVQKEGSTEILSKFSTLIEVSKGVTNRKISICGIPRRTDLSSYQDSRRFGVNMRLKEMCIEQGIEYI